MGRSVARADIVAREQLLEFVRPRHRGLLATTRRDGRPQISRLSIGVDGARRVVTATYPERAKTRNARRDSRVSVLVLSEEWDGPWVQVDATAEVLDAAGPDGTGEQRHGRPGEVAAAGDDRELEPDRHGWLSGPLAG